MSVLRQVIEALCLRLGGTLKRTFTVYTSNGYVYTQPTVRVLSECRWR